MAKRQFMSKRPVTRNRSKRAGRAKTRAEKNLRSGARRDSKDDLESKFEALFEPISAAIENERNRLAQAQSILVCVHTTMENLDEEVDDAPYYPELIDMARRLVREAVHRLDSVYRRPLIDQAKQIAKSRSAR